MKIAVLGATGRLGQNLITFAVETGYEVVALARNPERFVNVTGRSVSSMHADASDPASMVTALNGVDVVLSGIGIPRDGDPAILVGAATSLGESGATVIWPGRLGTGATAELPNSFVLKLTESEENARSESDALIRASGGTVIHADKFGREFAGQNRALEPAEWYGRGLRASRFQREDLAILMIDEALTRRFAGATAIVTVRQTNRV